MAKNIIEITLDQLIANGQKKYEAVCRERDALLNSNIKPARYYQLLTGGEVKIIVDLSPGMYKGKTYEMLITIMHDRDV